jgi:colicin import membrane protein
VELTFACGDAAEMKLPTGHVPARTRPARAKGIGDGADGLEQMPSHLSYGRSSTHQESEMSKRVFVGVVVVLVAIIAVACGEVQTEPQAAKTVTETVPAEGNAPAAVEEELREEQKANPEPAEPELSAGQENAIESASQYLEMGGFSRSGLIEQLKFEGFSTKDATFAVDAIGVDWNEQAVLSAEQYLEMGGFSRSALVDQLEFEGFTPKQAEYGVKRTY